MRGKYHGEFVVSPDGEFDVWCVYCQTWFNVWELEAREGLKTIPALARWLRVQRCQRGDHAKTATRPPQYEPRRT